MCAEAADLYWLRVSKSVRAAAVAFSAVDRSVAQRVGDVTPQQ